LKLSGCTLVIVRLLEEGIRRTRWEGRGQVERAGEEGDSESGGGEEGKRRGHGEHRKGARRELKSHAIKINKIRKFIYPAARVPPTATKILSPASHKRPK
jgi:hypothetical protein